jgi:hypothetical protein
MPAGCQLPDPPPSTSVAGSANGASGGTAGGEAGASTTKGGKGPSSPAGGEGGTDGDPSAGAAGTPGTDGGSPTVDTPQPNGAKCAADPDCALGHCVDGVCCASACTGCNACANSLTGQDDGTCAPVLVGTDPHDACADETASNQCGTDGTCDGSGACAKVSASHVCTQAGCSADGKSFRAASTCDRDGKGVCTTVAAQDCQGFPCTATGCAKPCAAQAECGTGNYCDLATGKCASLKPDGATATQAYQCASTLLADGVCCNEGCAGQCQSCKVTPGTCKNVTTPRSSCGGSGTCGTKLCDGAHAECVFPGNQVACPSSCSGDATAQLTSACNGSGACGAAQPTTCNAGNYCSGGKCTAKLATGTASCAGNVACSSNNCSASPTGGTMCCASGRANCSQGCYDLKSDAKHCGTCAGDCGPNNVCNNSVCQCAAGKLTCGRCASWNFESGTVEGWQAGTSTISVKATPAGAPFPGSQSLAVGPLTIPAFGSVQIKVQLCPNAGTSADATGFSFHLYMDGPAYASFKDLAVAIGSDGLQTGLGTGFGASNAVKTWLKVEDTGPTNAVGSLTINFVPSADWTGTIYLDQADFTPT